MKIKTKRTEGGGASGGKPTTKRRCRMGKSGENLSKEKRLTLCVSQAMFDKLTEQAKQEDTSVSAYVRKLIKDDLAKREA